MHTGGCRFMHTGEGWHLAERRPRRAKIGSGAAERLIFFRGATRCPACSPILCNHRHRSERRWSPRPLKRDREYRDDTQTIRAEVRWRLTARTIVRPLPWVFWSVQRLRYLPQCLRTGVLCLTETLAAYLSASAFTAFTALLRPMWSVGLPRDTPRALAESACRVRVEMRARSSHTCFRSARPPNRYAHRSSRIVLVAS
jgi:hypothetical protein